MNWIMDHLEFINQVREAEEGLIGREKSVDIGKPDHDTQTEI